MKQKRSLLLLLLLVVSMALFGCAADPGVSNETPQDKPYPEVITGEDSDPYGGADAYGRAGDNPNSRYFVNPDFYNMESDDQLTIIPNFKTFQQTSEWSCGVATSLMVLENYGLSGYTEMQLAEMAGANRDLDTEGSDNWSADNWPEYGTSVDDLQRLFAQIPELEIVETSFREYTPAEIVSDDNPASDGNLAPSFSSSSLYASENSDETDKWVEDAADSYFVQWIKGYLEAGTPIMVQWSDWAGHWQAMIGYDNNGTPGIGDDVLIFADPYDTSDHWQDGYYIYPLERWFYMWQDTNVAPKPYQFQPYIVVQPAA